LHFWRHSLPRRLETRVRVGHFRAAAGSDELISVGLGMVPRRGSGCGKVLSDRPAGEGAGRDPWLSELLARASREVEEDAQELRRPPR
jgi:hypothetical protein